MAVLVLLNFTLIPSQSARLGIPDPQGSSDKTSFTQLDARNQSGSEPRAPLNLKFAFFLENFRNVKNFRNLP